MGKIIIFKRTDDIRNTESMFHILHLESEAQSILFSLDKCSGYKLNKL